MPKVVKHFDNILTLKFDNNSNVFTVFVDIFNKAIFIADSQSFFGDYA